MLINLGTPIINGLKERVNPLFSHSIIIVNIHAFKNSLNFMEIQTKSVHLEMIFIYAINQIKIKIPFQTLAIVMQAMVFYQLKIKKNILQDHNIFLLKR